MIGNNNQLKSLIARIENLEEDKAALAADIKEIYTEAKSAGFDTATIRRVIRVRKMDEAKLERQQELMQIYLEALGALADLPLGQAALKEIQSTG